MFYSMEDTDVSKTMPISCPTHAQLMPLSIERA